MPLYSAGYEIMLNCLQFWHILVSHSNVGIAWTLYSFIMHLPPILGSVYTLQPVFYNRLYNGFRGVVKGGPGTPNPIPLKIIKDKTCTHRHALRIRLIELWMSWMNWELGIDCYELVGYLGYSSHACAKISCCDDVIYTECHGLRLGLSTVPYFPGRPVFRGLCPESRLGSSRDPKCPVFSWS